MIKVIIWLFCFSCWLIIASVLMRGEAVETHLIGLMKTHEDGFKLGPDLILSPQNPILMRTLKDMEGKRVTVIVRVAGESSPNKRRK